MVWAWPRLWMICHTSRQVSDTGRGRARLVPSDRTVADAVAFRSAAIDDAGLRVGVQAGLDAGERDQRSQAEARADTAKQRGEDRPGRERDCGRAATRRRCSAAKPPVPGATSAFRAARRADRPPPGRTGSADR